MLSEPRVETRAAQPYVGIRTNVTMQDFASAIDGTLAELRAWLMEHGLAASAGPPVFRYVRFGADGQMEVEFCIPLEAPTTGDARVASGEIPAGRYATALHVGHYDGLRDATAHLLDWGQQQGLHWDVDANGAWRARLETYLTDPSQEPDASKWQTQLAIKVAD